MRRVYARPNEPSRSRIRCCGASSQGKASVTLTRDPLRGRMGGYADPDQLPSQVTEDHQAIQQLKTRRFAPRTNRAMRCQRQDCAGMSSSPVRSVARRGPCTWRPSIGRPRSQHQQFTVDARRTPQRVLAAHATDQGSNLSINLGSATGSPRLPVPVGSKAAPMSTEHRLRLDHCDRLQERGE